MMQEILGPFDPIPEAVALPQVVKINRDEARFCDVVITRLGQRIEISAEVIEALPRDCLDARHAADAAIRNGGLR